MDGMTDCYVCQKQIDIGYMIHAADTQFEGRIVAQIEIVCEECYAKYKRWKELANAG